MRSCAVWLCLAMAVGCAHQIRITSDPDGARAIVNGNEIGTTPVSYAETTAPGGAHSLELRREGYKPFYGTLLRNVDWTTAGMICGAGALGCGGVNLLTAGSGLGYLIFLPAVGAAVFTFKGPDHFHATLERAPADAMEMRP